MGDGKTRERKEDAVKYEGNKWSERTERKGKWTMYRYKELEGFVFCIILSTGSITVGWTCICGTRNTTCMPRSLWGSLLETFTWNSNMEMGGLYWQGSYGITLRNYELPWTASNLSPRVEFWLPMLNTRRQGVSHICPNNVKLLHVGQNVYGFWAISGRDDDNLGLCSSSNLKGNNREALVFL